MSFIVAIILFAVLVSVYLVTFMINKKVKLPDDIDLSNLECNGCKITTCKHNTSFKEKEKLKD